MDVDVMDRGISGPHVLHVGCITSSHKTRKVKTSQLGYSLSLSSESFMIKAASVVMEFIRVCCLKW
jgi:hypothetical protein